MIRGRCGWLISRRIRRRRGSRRGIRGCAASWGCRSGSVMRCSATCTWLTRAAGESARLYEAARRQQRWIAASAEVTTALLSGAGTGEVLAGVTRRARELAGADLAVLAVPEGEGGRLVIRHADGDGAAAARGLVLPATASLSGRVVATGEPVS